LLQLPLLCLFFDYECIIIVQIRVFEKLDRLPQLKLYPVRCRSAKTKKSCN